MDYSCSQGELTAKMWLSSTTCSGPPDYEEPSFYGNQCAGGFGNYSFISYLVSGSEYVGCKLGSSSLGSSETTTSSSNEVGLIVASTVAVVTGLTAILALLYIHICTGQRTENPYRVVTPVRVGGRAADGLELGVTNLDPPNMNNGNQDGSRSLPPVLASAVIVETTGGAEVRL